ncbi:hypothetical protein ACP275_10G125000 [Erythranthe tilingii]
MAATPALPTTYNYPHEDYEEASTTTTADCGCLRRFRFGLYAKEESNSYLLHEEEGGVAAPLIKGAWLFVNLKKLRDFSELVAGPKWKKIVRKIGKININYKTTARFQYSPESYALNFAGGGDRPEDDDDLLHSFSTRFAPAGFSISTDQQKESCAK